MPPTLEELYVRGRAAYVARFVANDRAVVPRKLAVVTRADFLAHPGVCLDALREISSLYILNDDGSIDAMLCRYRFG